MNEAEKAIAALGEMFAPFAGGSQAVPRAEALAPEAMPQPYRRLLVHKRHMTLALATFHGSPVTVRVIERRQDDTTYTRKSVLLLTSTDRPVQFAVMKINLGLCSNCVRCEVLAGQVPLGQILIENKVLRRVEPWAYLKVWPSPEMTSLLKLESPQPLYGRLATIFCDQKRAIEVLEIPTPVGEKV